MAVTLKPHQIQALEGIRSMGAVCLVVAEAGSGKTHIAGEAISLILKKHGGKAIYVTEASAISQQKAKLDLHGLEVVVLSGTARDWEAVKDNQVAVCSHAVLRSDRKAIQAVEWTVAVVDEIHRCENGRAATAKALIGMGKNMGIRPPFRIGMTATPLGNGLKDCYPYLRWLHPSAPWQSWSAFAQDRLIPHPHIRGAYVGVRGREELERMMREITVQVDYTPSYPAPTVREVTVSLSPEAQAVYARLRDDMILDLATGRKELVANPAALVTKMRQFTAMPEAAGVALPSVKEAALLEVLASRKSGQKAIVFCQFTSVLDILAARHGWPTLKGGMTLRAKQEVLDSEPDVLLMSPAGEASLDAQWAGMVVSMDLPWHSGHLKQRNGRAVREGQTKAVEIVYITATGTYDKENDAIIRRKLKEQIRTFGL